MFNDLSISLQARGVRHIHVDVPDFSLGGLMYKSPDGSAAKAAPAIRTDISLRSILLRSISLVAPYAHTSLHASMRLDGRTALDLYNK